MGDDNEGNSRFSYDQGGAGLNITNFPTEPADPPYVLMMSRSIARWYDNGRQRTESS